MKPKLRLLPVLRHQKAEKKWTLELLQEELRTKEGFETINHESIRLILKKQHKTLAKTNVVHSGDGFNLIKLT
jgi:transposase